MVGEGAEREDCHPLTWGRLVQASRMRRCPPSYDWLTAQGAGYVAEIMAAWDALNAREAYETERAMREAERKRRAQPGGYGF